MFDEGSKEKKGGQLKRKNRIMLTITFAQPPPLPFIAILRCQNWTAYQLKKAIVLKNEKSWSWKGAGGEKKRKKKNEMMRNDFQVLEMKLRHFTGMGRKKVKRLCMTYATLNEMEGKNSSSEHFLYEGWRRVTSFLFNFLKLFIFWSQFFSLQNLVTLKVEIKKNELT